MNNYKVPTVQLREAYNRTLKAVELRGSAPFCCGPGDNSASYVLCKECPLNKTDCEEKHDVKYWRQWWKELTGEEDNDVDLLKKADMDNDDVDNHKFKVVYNLLHQPGEHIIESCVCGTVLECLRFWYREAIRWNSIAEGPISNIPDDFKDIYLKVYDSAGNLILFDTYTLESKGLKKTGWTRISENTPET